MRADRAKILRGLGLVTVGDISAIAISQQGEVCARSTDAVNIVVGNVGIEDMDENWALPDVALFIRMLRSFTSAKIEIVRKRSSFALSGDGVEWKYRLGNYESLATTSLDDVIGAIGKPKLSIPTTVDTLKRISTTQSVVCAEYIHFVSNDGKIKVVVGEEDTYSGIIDLEVSPEMDFEIKVPAARFVEIVSKIDEPNIKLQFHVDKAKVIRFAMSKFSWLVGAVTKIEKLGE